MSYAFSLPGIGTMLNSQERLRKALTENSNSYTISRDGFVSLDLEKAEVREAIKEQIMKLGDIKEEQHRK